MHKLEDLKTGDIGMTHDSGFLPKAIRYFMNIYANKFYGKSANKYYNHTFIILRRKEGIYAIEAAGKGMVGKLIQDRFTEDYIKNNILFCRPAKDFDNVEKSKIRDTIIKLALKAIRYQFSNFISWIIYILTKGGINLLRNSKINRAFCFELTTYIWNSIRSDFRFNVPTTNTVDLQFDNRFIKFTIDEI